MEEHSKPKKSTTKLFMSIWTECKFKSFFNSLTIFKLMRYTNPSGQEYIFPYSISREEALQRMEEYEKKVEQDERSGQQLFDDMFGDLWLMKIFFLTLFVILGANLMIDLLDSSMVKIIQERNETLQRSIDSMWLLLVTSKVSLLYEHNYN